MITKQQYDNAVELIKKYRNQINNEVNDLLISNDIHVIDLPFDIKLKGRILKCLLNMLYWDYKEKNYDPCNKYFFEQKYFSKLKAYDIFCDEFNLHDLKRTRNFGKSCLKEFERVKKLYS